jgi:hypothetical protein
MAAFTLSQMLPSGNRDLPAARVYPFPHPSAATMTVPALP